MKKVLIIGAGPAGITAGYELMKRTGQYDVTILEEASQVGGISKTVRHKGFRMDLGGHCFRTQNEVISDWWKDILPQQGAPALDEVKCQRMATLQEGGPDPEQEDDVLLVRNRVAHVLYQDKFFDYPIRMNVNTLRNMGIGSSIKAGIDFVGNSVSRKREVNLEHYYLNRFGKQLYKVFFEDYIEKLWGKHPSQIDTHVGIQYIKGQSVATVIRENDKNIDDPAFYYPKLGAGQMWECAARKFEEMGGVIHTNCTVLKLNRENSKVKSLTCVMDGEPIEVETDIVISTMPIKDLINSMADVPANIIDIASHLCYRDMVMVSLLVPKLNINVDAASKTLGNIIPDTWIYIQDKRRKLARVQVYNNWSPYLVEDPENTVWIGCEFYCEEGDDDWNRSEEEWVRFAKQEMSFLHLISSSTPVFESHRECVKKAYPSYFGSYDRFDDVVKYLDNVRNLYCIGRNGQHKCHDMSYAMMTAFAAVKNIVYNVDSRANIWDVKQSSTSPSAPATAPKSYQTSSPVPPKANAYVPPAPIKTPTKPISVPSAPVIQVPNQPKTVSKEMLRDVVEKERRSVREEVKPQEPVSFKTVDKMFASKDAVEDEATTLRQKEILSKKVTTVKELRPTLVVQEASDAEYEKVIDVSAKDNSNYEPVKFSVRKHEDIVEEPFKDYSAKDNYPEMTDEKDESAEEFVEEVKEEIAEEITEAIEEPVEDKADVEAAAEEVTEADAEETAEEVAEADAEETAEEVAEADAEETAAEEVTEADAEETAEEVTEADAEETAEEKTEADAEETAEEKTETVSEEKEEESKKDVHPLIRNMIPANEVMQKQVVKKSKERTPIPMAKDIDRSEDISVSPSVVTAESIDRSTSVKEVQKRGGMEAVRQFERVLSLEPVEQNTLKQEEEKERLEAERARIEEEKRLAEEKRKAEEEAERARIEEEKRLAEEKRKAEEAAERARIAEEKRLAEEKRKAEEAAERARIEEEKRLAEEKRKAEEAAERARIAEEKRLAEEKRKAEEEAERARIEEEKRLAEEKRKAEEAAERARIEEEKRLAAEKRKAEEAAERARIAEEKRLAKEAEKARIAEEKRLAKEAEKARLAEEKRLAKEAEKARLAEEKRKAEEEKARLAEEKRKEKQKANESVQPKKKVLKPENAEASVGKTATVGKITGRVIKTKIVEITPEETMKRKKR